MAARDQRNHRFWLGFALLVVVGVFLGLKVHQAISLVLGAKYNASAGSGSRSTVEKDLLAQAAGRDSLLKEDDSFPRDPFRSPSTSTVSRRQTPQPQQETEAPPPVLRALLYDNVNPSVQLSVGSMTSDWLLEGDTFEGWVIEGIGPDSVRLSKDDESVVLSTS